MEASFAWPSLDFPSHPLWLRATFSAIAIALPAFGIGVLNRKDHEIETDEGLRLSAGCMTFSVAFGAWVWWYSGAERGTDRLFRLLLRMRLACGDDLRSTSSHSCSPSGTAPPCLGIARTSCRRDVRYSRKSNKAL
jgi:hypothetical protein